MTPVTILSLLSLALWALPGKAAPRPPTVFLAGDSTMAAKAPERRPETGWGEAFAALFDAAEVRVENHARNGRSTRSFLGEGRWRAIVAALRPGDTVLIQFGHNDASPEKKDRYSPPAVFAANLRRFVAETRARGAVPVLLTPVERRRFDAAGRFVPSHGEYPDWVRAVAERENAALIDLQAASAERFARLGPEGTRRLFLHLRPGEHPNYPEGLADDTHFSPAGARLVAGLVAAALVGLDLPLARRLRPEALPDWRLDAWVDPAYDGPPGALARATPHYRRLGEALAAVRPDNARPFRIGLAAAVFREKVSVDRPFVHLIGAGVGKTVLRHGDAAGDPAPGGGRLGTEGSYTLRVAAPDFRAEGLTIENDYDYPANAALAEDDPRRNAHPQAVALLTTGASDRAVFENVAVLGYQDTLLHDAGRAWFHRCRIEGHVDFIFGAGTALFEDCDIVSRPRPGERPAGYVTAPSTPAMRPFGFVFLRSRLLAAGPKVEDGSVHLGRPWHPGADPRVNGSAVFLHCFMDAHIAKDGYAPISSRAPDGTRRIFDLEPDGRFFEFGSHGPGAHRGPRRPRLAPELLEAYRPEAVLGGWRPRGRRAEKNGPPIGGP